MNREKPIRALRWPCMTKSAKVLIEFGKMLQSQHQAGQPLPDCTISDSVCGWPIKRNDIEISDDHQWIGASFVLSLCLPTAWPFLPLLFPIYSQLWGLWPNPFGLLWPQNKDCIASGPVWAAAKLKPIGAFETFDSVTQCKLAVGACHREGRAGRIWGQGGAGGSLEKGVGESWWFQCVSNSCPFSIAWSLFFSFLPFLPLDLYQLYSWCMS